MTKKKLMGMAVALTIAAATYFLGPDMIKMMSEAVEESPTSQPAENK